MLQTQSPFAYVRTVMIERLVNKEAYVLVSHEQLSDALRHATIAKNNILKEDIKLLLLPVRELIGYLNPASR